MKWKAYSITGIYVGAFYCDFGKRKALEKARGVWGDDVVYYVEPAFMPETTND
jgi:hypothetical protein